MDSLIKAEFSYYKPTQDMNKGVKKNLCNVRKLTICQNILRRNSDSNRTGFERNSETKKRNQEKTTRLCLGCENGHDR